MIKLTLETELGPRKIKIDRAISKELIEAAQDPEAFAIAEFLIAWRTLQLEVESYKLELLQGAGKDA